MSTPDDSVQTVCREGDKIEHHPSPYPQPLTDANKSVFSCERDYREKKKLEKKGLKLITTKRTRRVADAHVHRGFHDNLDPFTLSGLGNAENGLIQLLDGEWIEMFLLSSYDTKTV